MPILPKYQLKYLFESGDLITETTLDQLIDATYNDNLVAGTNITLNKVTTPSGTTITINSAGGGGGGTVTSVGVISSTFVTSIVTNPTTSPVITSSLSATGIPSATTFLRGDNTWATAGAGSVTSVGLSMPAAFTVTNSPVTGIGILTVAGSGTALEYVDGTGALQTFPPVGITYQGGDGINIDVATVPDTIEIDLYTLGCGPEGANLEFVGGQLNFKGLHIRDEGLAIGSFQTINFIGADVQAISTGDPCVVDVYIPTPQFASHFNTNSPGTTNAECNCNVTSYSTPRISKPTTEGNPFKTGGGANALWAATNSKATYTDGGTGVLTFTTVQDCTGFGGDSTITVNIYDADGASVLITGGTFTTPVLVANGTHTSGDTFITVTIANYAADTTKFKAKPSFNIKFGSILAANALTGGRYHVELIHKTDSITDTGLDYKYFGPNGNTIPASQTYSSTTQDVFFDTNPSTPDITGTTTIVQSPSGTINTKHLSGVEYYILNSEFEVEVKDIDNYNANSQGRSGVTTWNFRTTGVDYGLTTQQLQAWSPANGTFSGTNWPDFYNAIDVDYIWSNWPITSNNWRFRNTTANCTGQVYDPWGGPVAESSGNAPVLIDTYGTTSTDMIERFDDEVQRLARTGSYTAFNSTPPLGGSGLANQTTSVLSPGPFCQAATVGGSLVRPDKFYADNGNSPQTATIIADLASAPYLPIVGGANPDYSVASYQVSSTYHRKFELLGSNFSRPVSSFELTFVGYFGVGSTAFDALVANDLKVYIRKLECASVGVNIGYNAIPHSLHNTNVASGTYTNPPAAVDDNSSSQCRTTTTSTNTIAGTFSSASRQMMNGMYIEIHIDNPVIRLDQIDLKVIFAAGSPTTQP